MRKHQGVNFHCYAPRPASADLPALEATVLRTLKDARGFLSHKGMTVPLVVGIIGHNIVSEGIVHATFHRLKESGFVEEVSADRWRAKR